MIKSQNVGSEDGVHNTKLEVHAIKVFIQFFFFIYTSLKFPGQTGGREISAIIVTDDYLCYKEPKSLYNFFLILIFNE